MVKCTQGVCENEAIKFEFCCWNCPHNGTCEVKCENEPSECGNSETAEDAAVLAVFENRAGAIMGGIADLMTQKKNIEATEKEMRVQLEAVMSEYGMKKIDHHLLKITHIAPTTKTSVDSKKLKETYPHIHAECSKTSDVKGYVKIELKGDKA